MIWYNLLGKIITTIKLTNTSITSHNYYFVWVSWGCLKSTLIANFKDIESIINYNHYTVH